MAASAEGVPRASDLALAGGLAVFAQVDLRYNLDNSTRYGSSFAVAVVVAVATLAIAWSRHRPLLTVCVVVTVTAGPELFTRLTVTLWGHFVPLLIAAYGVARWCASRRTTAAAVVLLGTAVLVLVLRVPSLRTAANIPFTVVPITTALAAGRVLHHRQARHHALVARASQLEADHEAHVATALTDERARIARELHDIVAHCVSVMVVQAGAAEELLEREPGRARDSVRAVQDTGRQAIAELGRMLGVLRQPTLDGEKQWGELAPQPGAADLWELSERMSRSGLPVQLVVSGERRALPPGIDLTTYRIVQEALTNALKHGGPGAKAHVELRYTSTTLDLEIRNDGTTPPPVGTGQGLIGMAERVAVYGGVVETGSRPEGGFGVHVVLPLGTP